MTVPNSSILILFLHSPRQKKEDAEKERREKQNMLIEKIFNVFARFATIQDGKTKTSKLEFILKCCLSAASNNLLVPPPGSLKKCYTCICHECWWWRHLNSIAGVENSHQSTVSSSGQLVAHSFSGSLPQVLLVCDSIFVLDKLLVQFRQTTARRWIALHLLLLLQLQVVAFPLVLSQIMYFIWPFNSITCSNWPSIPAAGLLQEHPRLQGKDTVLLWWVNPPIYYHQGYSHNGQQLVHTARISRVNGLSKEVMWRSPFEGFMHPDDIEYTISEQTKSKSRWRTPYVATLLIN